MLCCCVEKNGSIYHILSEKLKIRCLPHLPASLPINVFSDTNLLNQFRPEPPKKSQVQYVACVWDIETELTLDLWKGVMLLLGWRCVCSCSITNPGEDVGCKSSCYTLQSTCIYKGTMRFHFVNGDSRKTINVEYLQWQKWQTYCRMKIRKHGWRQEIACSNHIHLPVINVAKENIASLKELQVQCLTFSTITLDTLMWNEIYLNGMQRTTRCKCNLCKQMRWKKYIDSDQSYQKRKKNSFLISWHI